MTGEKSLEVLDMSIANVGDARNEESFATQKADHKSADRKDNRVRDQIAGQHPCASAVARAQIAPDMRKRVGQRIRCDFHTGSLRPRLAPSDSAEDATDFLR
jgi:hypothetical protein